MPHFLRQFGIYIIGLSLAFFSHAVLASENPKDSRTRSSCMLSAKQAIKLYKSDKKAVLVDIRKAAEYERLHISNSINMPAYELRQKLFLKNKHIILLDRGHNQKQSIKACKTLKSSGFKYVKVLQDGLYGWMLAGGQLNGNIIEQDGLYFVDAGELINKNQREDYHVISLSKEHDAFLKKQFLKVIKVRNHYQAKTALQSEIMNRKPNYRLLVVDDDEKELVPLFNYVKKQKIHNVVFLRGGIESYHKELQKVSAMKNKKGFVLQDLRSCN